MVDVLIGFDPATAVLGDPRGGRDSSPRVFYPNGTGDVSKADNDGSGGFCN
jgi:hypothetical protein